MDIVRRLRSESGQVVVFTALAITAMLGMSAFVLDVGLAYRGHRTAQAAADASALAAAQNLPTSTSAAQTASAQEASANFPQGAVTLTLGQTYVAHDTATARATTTVSTFFARVLGRNQFGVATTAKAVSGSYTGWANNVAPWVIDKPNLNFGQSYTFKVQPGDQVSSGNFGALRLPIQQSSCGTGSGTSTYRSLINGTYNSCLVQVGSVLSPETGNMGQNTQHALQDRGTIQNFDPYSILQLQTNGMYKLTTYNHPNLVVIPVIDHFSNGQSSFTITGFAWFIITSYGSDTVTGMFIQSGAPGGAICPTASNPSAPCPVGGYSSYGFQTVVLSG